MTEKVGWYDEGWRARDHGARGTMGKDAGPKRGGEEGIGADLRGEGIM